MSESPQQNPNEIAAPVRRGYGTQAFPVETAAPATLCAYCGAPLDPFFYFCLRCATPYKNALSIVGPQRPVPLSDEQRINKMAPHTWTVFWTYAIVLIISAIVAIPFDTPEGQVVWYFIGTLAILVTTIVFACIHWRPLKGQLLNIGFLKWEAWAGLGMLVPLLLLNFGYFTLLKNIPGIHMQELPDSMPLAWSVVIFCLFPAVTEEIAFRGLLQYWLDIAVRPGFALVLGSAMFAAMHFSVLSAPYLMLVGMALAWTRRRTGSLYPGMLMHFLHNLVVIAFFR